MKQQHFADDTATPKLTLSVDHAAAISGLGRHALRDAIEARALPAVRVGRAVRIPVASLEKWLVEAAERGANLADFRAVRRESWPSEQLRARRPRV